MDFKLKPKNIIKFYCDNTIKISDNYSYAISKINENTNIEMESDFILNLKELLNLPKNNKKYIFYFSNDRIGNTYSLIYEHLDKRSLIVEIPKDKGFILNNIYYYGEICMVFLNLDLVVRFYILETTTRKKIENGMIL